MPESSSVLSSSKDDPEYKQGFEEGYEKGLAYAQGYKEGFEAAKEAFLKSLREQQEQNLLCAAAPAQRNRYSSYDLDDDDDFFYDEEEERCQIRDEEQTWILSRIEHHTGMMAKLADNVILFKLGEKMVDDSVDIIKSTFDSIFDVSRPGKKGGWW
ncbi:MAG TPA: hypothetical protein O0X70_03605 [Methanocorpusculum sp.]|nr:hypothetical protein [Methanocorpusculum sp.]